jgi:hypothetical protein
MTRDIVTTLALRVPVWREQTRLVDRSTMSPPALVRCLVRESGDARALVLNGVVGRYARYSDLVAAVLVARRRNAPVVLLSEVNWKSGSGAVSQAFRRAGARALRHRRIFICVLSRDDLAAVARGWGLAERQILVTPYPYTLTADDLEQPVGDDGSVFAGGNSLRDYGPLLQAARDLPARVTIATDRVSEAERAGLPAHMEVGPVAHDRFMALLRSASVVVVAIEERYDRSAGIQTYVNAMALGKLVVVTDTMAVRDYVEHKRTGLIVPPRDPEALAEALRWALDPANAGQVAAIRAAARQVAREKLRPDDYADALLRAVQTALGR